MSLRIRGIPKREFRKRLVALSAGCAVQTGGWPCGGCFPWGQARWHAVLVFRGSCEDAKTAEGYRLASDIVRKADGTFSHHVFIDVPIEAIRRDIAAIWAEMTRPSEVTH
jgi:hypothetical protein